MGAGSTLLVSGAVIGAAWYFLSKPKKASKGSSPARSRKAVCRTVTRGHMEGFMASSKKMAALKRGSSTTELGLKVGRKADGSYYICD